MKAEAVSYKCRKVEHVRDANGSATIFRYPFGPKGKDWFSNACKRTRSLQSHGASRQMPFWEPFLRTHGGFYSIPGPVYGQVTSARRRCGLTSRIAMAVA